MSHYRHALPQLGPELFVTDAGLETTLVYHERLELPAFAAFPLLVSSDGRAVLHRYYSRYMTLAREYGLGIVLESPTWRASRDWGEKLGFDAAALADVNRRAIRMMEEVRAEHAHSVHAAVISGNLGPRGDGYVAGTRMSIAEAYEFHSPQVAVFAQSAADMVAAFTMNYAEEAIGIVRAARAHDMPVAIAFTVETDGRLPSGEALPQAIARTDAETDGAAAYFMINCAHPEHFADVLAKPGAWRERIRGLRANASTLSHAELDTMTELDAGDPADLAQRYRALDAVLPRLNVVGGCCGTDDRHVVAIVRELTARRAVSGVNRSRVCA